MVLWSRKIRPNSARSSSIPFQILPRGIFCCTSRFQCSAVQALSRSRACLSHHRFSMVYWLLRYHDSVYAVPTSSPHPTYLPYTDQISMLVAHLHGDLLPSPDLEIFSAYYWNIFYLERASIFDPRKLHVKEERAY